VLTTRLSSSISFYKTLLGIRTVIPISETTVQLEYDIPSSNPITLLLEYDPLSRRLVDASVGPHLYVSVFSSLSSYLERIRE
jgi:hypothetical protein